MAGASAAVMSKIMSHQGAAEALGVTMAAMAKQQASGQTDTTFRPGAGLADAHREASNGAPADASEPTSGQTADA